MSGTIIKIFYLQPLSFFKAANVAILTAMIAGWVFSVRFNTVGSLPKIISLILNLKHHQLHQKCVWIPQNSHIKLSHTQILDPCPGKTIHFIIFNKYIY